MKLALIIGVALGAVILTGCAGEEEQATVPFPTVTATGLPPPPDENIVPEQENGEPLPLPSDAEEAQGADLPPVTPTPTAIIVTAPPPVQLPTVQGDAQAVVSVIVSNLIDYARRSPESTVILGTGVLSYTGPDGESLNTALPEGVIVTIGTDTLVPPIDAMFIQGNYCVSIPNPDDSDEYYVLSGPVAAPPSTLPALQKKPCG